MKHRRGKDQEAAAALRPQTFRPYFRENYVFFSMLLAGGGVFLYGASKSSGVGDLLRGLAMGSAIISVVAVLRFRFYVAVDEKYLTSRGCFTAKRIKWSEIRHVVRKGASDPYSSAYPPFLYEFRGDNASLTINFKLFSRDCWHTIRTKIETLSIHMR